MAFYHDLITEESWRELQHLQKQIQFVLIGGWATYLYTKALKSKDIDIIIAYDQLPLLEKNYTLTKNDRLKKYEARKGPVEIDVYLPFFSNLGLPVEDVIKKTKQHEGFTIIAPEWLLALKIYTLSQRGRTPKGKKDFLDIISLFQLPDISSETVQVLLADYQLERAWTNFLAHLQEHQELQELGFNAHQFSKIKKKIRD